MKGEFEARLPIAPHGAGESATAAGAIQRLFATTVTGSATQIAILNDTLGNVNIPEGGVFISWCSDTDCYLQFAGAFAFGGAFPTASATTGLFLPAGVVLTLFHRRALDSRGSVIRKTADGTLMHWMSQP